MPSLDLRQSAAVRIEYPPHDSLCFEVPVLSEGDVNARVGIRVQVEQRLALIDQILDRLPQGALRADGTLRPEAR